MPLVLHYVYEGKKADTAGDNAGKLPIDVTLENNLAEDMRFAGDVKTIEELKAFFRDCYWAMDAFYYLRNVSEVNPNVVVDLDAILKQKEERRGNGIDVCKVNFDRRPRTYTAHRPLPRWLEP